MIKFINCQNGGTRSSMRSACGDGCQSRALVQICSHPNTHVIFHFFAALSLLVSATALSFCTATSDHLSDPITLGSDENAGLDQAVHRMRLWEAAPAAARVDAGGVPASRSWNARRPKPACTSIATHAVIPRCDRLPDLLSLAGRVLSRHGMQDVCPRKCFLLKCRSWIDWSFVIFFEPAFFGRSCVLVSDSQWLVSCTVDFETSRDRSECWPRGRLSEYKPQATQQSGHQRGLRRSSLELSWKPDFGFFAVAALVDWPAKYIWRERAD